MAENDPRSEQHAVPHATEEKRFSEAYEVVQVAVLVAGPVLGGVAGAVTSHHLQNKPSGQTDTANPPAIVLPPGVSKDE